jgi:hypothetical protein
MEPAPRDPTATAILPELLNLTSVPAGGLAGKLPPQSIRVAQRTTATLLGVGQWSLGSSDVEPMRTSIGASNSAAMSGAVRWLQGGVQQIVDP